MESRIELRLKKNKSESTISRRNGKLVEPSVINEAAGERPSPAGGGGRALDRTVPIGHTESTGTPDTQADEI